MKKINIFIICIALVLTSITGCGTVQNKEKKEAHCVLGVAISGAEYQTKINQKIKENDTIGAQFPKTVYISDTYVVFASHIGMFVIDRKTATLDSYVDLEKYDCNYFQGDILTKIQMDENEKNLYFYNAINDEAVNGQAYCLNIASKEIKQYNSEIPNNKNSLKTKEFSNFFKELKEETRTQLDKYKNVEKGEVYQKGNLAVFAKAEEWKLSNLEFVLIDIDSGKIVIIQSESETFFSIKEVEYTPALSKKDFVVKNKDTVIKLNQPFEEAKIGEQVIKYRDVTLNHPYEVYSYKNFVLSVCDEIFFIKLTTPALETARGVKVGDNISKVLEMYGEPDDVYTDDEQGKRYYYPARYKWIEFWTDKNGKITGIELELL